jgi:hypothetical protein
VSIVERIVTVYNDKGSKQAVKDLKKLEKNFIDSGKKIGKAFGVATLAVGAFATKIGVDAVKGAMEDQKQQAALATALRNTTGATDEAIAATTAYLDKLELLVGVDNNELIPSLQILTQATRDVTQAQALQSLALDISAGTSKDLTSVSLALAKALGGNVGALTKLGVPLDASAVKAKDLNAILTSLGETFAGQAEKRAETFEFRMMKLQLAFNQIIDQIGYALIPVLEEFAQYVVQNVLPAIQQWVDSNKDELAAGLKDVGTTLVTVGKALVGFFKVIADNLGVVKAFAAIFVGAKLASGIYAIVTAVGLLRAAFVKQAAAATAAGTATAFATGGASAIAAAAAIGVFVAAAGAAYIGINKLTAATDKGATSTQAYNSHLKELGKVAEQVAAANIKNTKIINNNTKGTKELTAAEKKAAEMRAAIKKAGLDVFGIKSVSDTDPVQLEAARLNLLKQNNLEELRKIEILIKSAEAQMKVNQNAQKYADILVALADNKISPEEIGVLAAKWGISNAAVTNYLATIFIVKDAKIDDSEVGLLAAAWGISKEAAQKYLDFYAALNDGKLSDEEIKKLQDKWGLTYKEVLQYADFVGKLDDFTLSDEEIKKLSDAWGLTKDQVLAYTEQIGIPVSYSGTLITPAEAAEAGWNKANTALTAYITQLNTAITQSAAANAAAVAAFTETQKAIDNANLASSKSATATEQAASAVAAADAAAAYAAAVTEAAAAARAAADAMAGLTDAEKAAIIAETEAATAVGAAAAAATDAAAQAAADAVAGAIAAAAADAAAQAAADAADAAGAGLGGKAGGSAAVGGSAGDRVNPIGGDLIALASGGIVTSPTMALIGEAGPEAVIPLSRGGGFGGGITITVNNAGSVIAEADLVSSIRNALLQAQNNGQVITKSSVAI